MTITIADGDWFFITSAVDCITRLLILIKSLLVIPGDRARPAVTITTSDPEIRSKVSLPTILVLDLVMPLAWFRSSAVAAANPGTISTIAISLDKSKFAAKCEMLAPTPPAPTIEIFENLFALLEIPLSGAIHFGDRRYKLRPMDVLPSVRASVGFSIGPVINSIPSLCAVSLAKLVTISPGKISKIKRPRCRASSICSEPMTRFSDIK